MTIRPRSLKAVQVARLRLRDLASADVHRAQTDAGVAQAAATTASATLDRTLDACVQQMRASTITGLIRISADVETTRAQATDSAARRDAAATAARIAAERLTRRERDLRTVERAIDMTRTAANDRAADDEQRLGDDLSARRRGP